MENIISEISKEQIDAYRDILNCTQNSDNWKEKTRYIEVRTYDEAERISKALNWFLGGSEIEQSTKVQKSLTGERLISVYTVGSKGYYHYIGA